MSDISNFEIPDVDLDVNDRSLALSVLKNYTRASEVREDEFFPHNTGIYLQRIPIDSVTELAAFPYKEAEELGYYKVDVIPNHVYDLIDSNEELELLLDESIDWSWFVNKRFFYEDGKDSRFVLTHLGKHLSLCEQYPPKSVEDIAILIALIRPAKRHLMGEDWEVIKQRIWDKEEGYAFKKSHAIAFAVLVTIHAKLIHKNIN